MSYLDDPRVFLATERTLLAYIRTELAILAFAFLVKKFGLDAHLEGDYRHFIDVAIGALCVTTVAVSLLATVQAWVSVNHLGPDEIPRPLGKRIIQISGILSVVLSAALSVVIMMV